MSIHYLNRTRPNRRFTLQKQNVLLCLLIVHILLIQPDTPGVLASENDDPLTKGNNIIIRLMLDFLYNIRLILIPFKMN